MKKLVCFIEKFIIVCFVIMYSLVLLNNVVFQYLDYYFKREFALPNIIMIVLAILLFYGGCKWYASNKEKVERLLLNSDKIIWIGTIFLLVFQLFLSTNIYFLTGWDPGMLTRNADYVANGQVSEYINWYYSQYPNNSLLTAIYSIVFWCAEHIGIPSVAVRLLIVFGQCAISSWTGYLLYKCAKKMFCERIAPMMVWVLYVLVQGISPWVVIPYSDASCLFIPMLLFWIYQSMENGRLVIGKAVSLGIIGYLGYEMKPMVIIVVLAILGIEFLENMKQKFNKKNWKVFFVICVSLVCTVGVCSRIDLNKIMGFEITEGRQFGITHYFMMGLGDENDGVYDENDVNFSREYNTNAQRNHANLVEAGKRIKDYGVVGLLKHTVKKALVNFNDGTFAWGNEGGFYGILLPIPNNPITNFVRSFYMENASNGWWFDNISQLIWIITLVGVVGNIAVFRRLKDGFDKYSLVAYTAMIGIGMFVMLFEARARYLYTFIPFFVMMSVKGYCEWYQWNKKRRNDLENKRKRQLL